jgi:hypothetical protein
MVKVDDSKCGEGKTQLITITALHQVRGCAVLPRHSVLMPANPPALLQHAKVPSTCAVLTC